MLTADTWLTREEKIILLGVIVDCIIVVILLSEFIIPTRVKGVR